MMANITITIPDAQAQRVLDAIARRHGWDPGGAVTKAQFARNVIANFIKRSVNEQERQDILNAADVTDPDVS
jgi:hypothetical protein